jgi:UDP-glucuronate 4-epimerase
VKILVTGAAGFIGFHLIRRLLENGNEVIGIDNVNEYYDVNLKFGRLAELGITHTDIEYGKLLQSSNLPGFSFMKLDIEDASELKKLFASAGFEKVCNLAAQAGVRYSLTNPDAYIKSNICGFLNILEMCRHYEIKHLIYASSSSVYGLNKQQPFSTSDNVDHPVSLYAASKKSNELMAHTYSHLFNIPTTGLRFFTVYGPWGRPDMALFLFTRAILNNEPIDVFNQGDMWRDFTYVGDIAEGIIRVIDRIPPGIQKIDQITPDTSTAPYKIYNIGNNSPVKLTDFIEAIEKRLGKKAIRKLLPLQPGDVPSTYADITDLIRDVNYKPQTSIESGIGYFVEWYTKFYNQ